MLLPLFWSAYIKILKQCKYILIGTYVKVQWRANVTTTKPFFFSINVKFIFVKFKVDIGLKEFDFLGRLTCVDSISFKMKNPYKNALTTKTNPSRKLRKHANDFF